jgi:protein-S-isoprenylcysteine O-methyltransferase Ste14
MDDLSFHIMFSIVYLGFILVRMIAGWSAIRAKGKVEYKEGKLNMTIRGIVGLGYVGALLVYIVYPDFLSWAIMPLPAGVRWIGAGLALTSIPLIAWVQWSLGRNFNTTLHVREGHTLVTNGPYHWVRHPMYTVLFLFGIGLMLVTANWMVGGPIAVALAGIVALRIPKEEALMIEQFGDEYRAYMQRTGRFLPRLEA